MIQHVNEKLLKISLNEVKPFLDAKHSADPVVGIVIVDLPELEIEGSSGFIYHFHAARIFTSSNETPNFVNPHYHMKGEEPYHILAGDKGEMNIGKVVDGKVLWQEPKIIKTGDLIEVQEGEVHSLRNLGLTPLDFTFACPDEHLIDHSSEQPEGDRYLTKNLQDGFPSQYSVVS